MTQLTKLKSITIQQDDGEFITLNNPEFTNRFYPRSERDCAAGWASIITVFGRDTENNNLMSFDLVDTE